MAVRNAPSWLQNGSHSAEDDRQLLAGLLGGSLNQAITSGIVAAADLKVSQHAGTANMSVDVSKGAAFIAGTESTVQGVYHLVNDDIVTVTISTADATNKRIDLIVSQVLDDQYSGASHIGQIVAVTGTPGASPSPPATPKNALVLAHIEVDAAVTSIVTAKITDERTFSMFPVGYAVRGNPAGSAFGGAQTIASGSFVKMTGLTSDFMAGGMALTSDALVVPVAGLYRVSATVAWNQTFGASAVELATGVFQNGTAVAQASTGAQSVNPAPTVSRLLKCAAGDSLTLRAFQGSGSSLNTLGGTNLSWIDAVLVSS